MEHSCRIRPRRSRSRATRSAPPRTSPTANSSKTWCTRRRATPIFPSGRPTRRARARSTGSMHRPLRPVHRRSLATTRTSYRCCSSSPTAPAAGNGRRAPGDVPSRGFHAIFTDNRNIIPPHSPPRRYEMGSLLRLRTARHGGRSVHQRWVTQLKRLHLPRRRGPRDQHPDNLPNSSMSTQRSFPFSVRNRTDVPRFYRFEIDRANTGEASFSLTDASTLIAAR